MVTYTDLALLAQLTIITIPQYGLAVTPRCVEFTELNQVAQVTETGTPFIALRSKLRDSTKPIRIGIK